MTRRALFLMTALAPLRLGADQAQASVRGQLRQGDDAKPGITTREGKSVDLLGDTSTVGVLKDPRLKGMDFEALGHYTGPTVFQVDPIYKKALFVWRGGKRLMVTYWCPICSIRAWTPGPCQCCQRPMNLDLRDPSLEETAPTN